MGHARYVDVHPHKALPFAVAHAGGINNEGRQFFGTCRDIDAVDNKNRQLGDLTGRVVRRVQASNPGGVSKGRMRSSHSQTGVLQLTLTTLYLAPSAECRQGLLVVPLASSHCG